jgi:hypothetical protein
MATKQNYRDSDRESQKPYTPQPPQHIDPSKPPKKQEGQSVESSNNHKRPRKYSDVEREKRGKAKQLGESETEINDETTI